MLSKSSCLPAELKEWVSKHEEKTGRHLRVLHIGNIANNAYQNASLMRQVGIESDVLCFDYYHIMACPEWEAADYKGDIKNQFHPDWTKVEMGSYKRPDWFVQGPLNLCLRYLVSRRNGDENASLKYWKLLSYSNRTVPIALKDRPLMAIYIVLFNINRWFNLLTDPPRVSRIIDGIEGSLKGRYIDVWKILRTIWPLVKKSTVCFSWVLMKIRIIIAKKSREEEYKKLTVNLIKEFGAAFPDRKDQLINDDFTQFKKTLWPFKNLFSYYDLIIGYGTDPIYPMISDVPYFALEHGTLREIPYQDSPVGRLTALAYHKAKGVFVTNSDCLNNAHDLTNNKAIIIPHPYDECLTSSRVSMKETSDLRKQLLQNLDADILFFHPTRQDWKQGTGFADKGNDVFFRAFSDLRKSGIKVGVVCCSWGRNVPQSKELINSLECSNHVAWYEPMASVTFERMITACDVVVDQFVLGAFGGVLYRALALGKPVCTYLDVSSVKSSYKTIPPVINCCNEEEIVRSLMSAINTPNELDSIGSQGKDWMDEYHSGKQTVITQLELIKSVLENKKSMNR